MQNRVYTWRRAITIFERSIVQSRVTLRGAQLLVITLHGANVNVIHIHGNQRQAEYMTNHGDMS